MNRYVALLRGINVGGNKKVEMSKLKHMFESLGFTDVSTYINSGNAIFQSDHKISTDDFSHINHALKKTFGFDIPFMIRDAKNIEKLCKHIPPVWQNNTEERTDVLFLSDEYNKKSTIALIKHDPHIDHLLYTDGAIIWNINREHYSKSGMRKFIGTPVYKNMTARNVNTVRKLCELLSCNF